mmetsp:Transcript_17324/g.26242  ORF Transcript_17324/g.26242 Transcript_17324/m.26242 type:complete len:438 (-) Transcript_17324:345-1658(-)|eukprot:CAMPEP_0178901004 /NCGR_PEP_ID=MMETSP0786-20121207/3777_1 /TAXON_ID=186022 /ORGANISM="Thalassionema frauenfeldii, Strain CCMP 1798" /LENGTH=437 /DNA_ID=CAMNT_0020572049 /DNA_START=54 /DNA_END=1367 /DNA_ORIENTATION=-
MNGTRTYFLILALIAFRFLSLGVQFSDVDFVWRRETTTYNNAIATNPTTIHEEHGIQEKTTAKSDGTIGPHVMASSMKTVADNTENIFTELNDTEKINNNSTISKKEDLLLAGRRRVFLCGCPVDDRMQTVFPEFDQVEIKNFRKKYKTTSNDILFYGMYGKCHGGGKKRLGIDWMAQNFPGKVIYFNWEAHGGDLWDQGTPPPRAYHLGYVRNTNQSVQVTCLAQVLLGKLSTVREQLFVRERKPKNLNESFLIYTASNCVPFREEAAAQLSAINTIHYGGRCKGSNATDALEQKATPYQAGSWVDNIELYRHYRFCLVMENEFHWRAGYITEKIALAFAAGCVPLYFGWEGIFEIFNPRSFIFYDIHNPKPAFEKVAYLEANQSAYHEMLAEPILKDGNHTINRWFSLSDDVGDGSLKKKIRKTLMLDSSFESRI